MTLGHASLAGSFGGGDAPELGTWSRLEAHFAAHGFVPSHVVEGPPVASLGVHVTVQVCPPTARHRAIALYTSGMSDRAQAVPPEREDCRFGELVLLLPASFPGLFDEIRIVNGPTTVACGHTPADPRHRSPEHEWPLQWLLALGRHPHLTGSWVGPGHLLPTGDPTPLPGTGFTGFVLLEPLTIPWEVPMPDRRVALHQVVPLYPEEIALKRALGTPELLRRFGEQGVSEIADPLRPNVAAGFAPPRGRERRGWWPFKN